MEFRRVIRRKTSTGTDKMRKTNALYLKIQRLIAETHRDTEGHTETHTKTQRETHTDTHRHRHTYTHTKRYTQRDTHKKTHTKSCFRGLPFLLLHT